MNESINKLKELAALLQDPNCDVNVVTLGIADLLDTLPKLLAVVEAGRGLRRAFRDNIHGDPIQITILGRPAAKAWDNAMDALEEEV